MAAGAAMPARAERRASSAAGSGPGPYRGAAARREATRGSAAASGRGQKAPPGVAQSGTETRRVTSAARLSRRLVRSLGAVTRSYAASSR